MKNSSRGFAHLVLIIGVVLVGILGIMYFAVKSGQIKFNPSPQSNSSPTPTSTINNRCFLEPDPGPCKALFQSHYFDQQEKKCKEFNWGGCDGARPFETLKECQQSCETETVVWKTYRNERYNYTIQLPDNWIEEVKCLGGHTTDDYVCYFSPDYEGNPEGLLWGILDQGGYLTIDGQGGLVGLHTDDFCTSSEQVQIEECEKIMIGSVNALKRKIGNRIQIGVVINERVVLSLRFIYSIESEKEILSTLDQILSTFKFFDADFEAICLENGGGWIEEFKECEGISEEVCTTNGGVFDECAYPIDCNQGRHGNRGEWDCTEGCIQVCTFEFADTSGSENLTCNSSENCRDLSCPASLDPLCAIYPGCFNNICECSLVCQ